MESRMQPDRTTLLNSTGLDRGDGTECAKMDSSMCHRATVMSAVTRIGGILILGAFLPLAAQTPADSVRPNWRRVGGPTVDLALAAPATGPVSRVWFTSDGSHLYALTESGRTFESTDLETWAPVANTMPLPDLPAATDLRTPESGARLVSHPRDSRRVYAQGDRHLYRS